MTLELQEQPNLVWARYYVSQGWKIIPIHVLINGECSCRRGPEICVVGKDAGKHPVQGGWNSPSAWVQSEAGCMRWWGDPRGIPYSIGLVCGSASGVWLLDVDPRNGGFDSLERLEAEWGESLPATRVAQTGGGGRHFFFTVPEGTKIKKGPLHKDYPGLDVQADGSQSVLAPSSHASGKRYEWATPPDQAIVEAPRALAEMLVGDRGHPGAGLGGGALDVEALLKAGIPKGQRNEILYKLACSLARKLGHKSDLEKQLVISTMETINQQRCAEPLDKAELNKILVSAITFIEANPGFRDELPEGIKQWMEARGTPIQGAAPAEVGSGPAPAGPTGAPLPDAPPELGAAAQANVADAAAQLAAGAGGGDAGGGAAGAAGGGAAGPPVPPVPPGGGGLNPAFGPAGLPPDADSLGPDGEPGHRTLTENGNVRRLVDYFGDDMKYTPGHGWYLWGGEWWEHDVERLRVVAYARELPVRIVSELPNWVPTLHQDVIDWATRSKGVGMIKKVVDTANSDPRVFVPVGVWDSDQMYLGVANGVVDLRTGSLLPPTRDQYITKRTAVPYVAGKRDPRWEIFLDQVTGGDKEYQAWLQRAVGYTLTGDTREEKFFVVFGPSGSGKSTFLEIVMALLGMYALTMQADNIMAQKGFASQADYYFNAQIDGKRMIAVSELPDAQNMKEDAVKRLTGSDTLVGRHPNERPFSFVSRAKLWVATNHQPRVDDLAMWRRLLALPFLFTPQVVDPTLKPYLRDPEGGLQAVLAWAVEGAVRWVNSRDGIGMCSAVRDATEEYKKNEDRIGIFLSEEAMTGEGIQVDLADLHASYDLWSRERLERPMGQTAFRKKLVERGIEVSKTGRTQLVLGWCLVPRAVENNTWNSLVQRAR